MVGCKMRPDLLSCLSLALEGKPTSSPAWGENPKPSHREARANHSTAAQPNDNLHITSTYNFVLFFKQLLSEEIISLLGIGSYIFVLKRSQRWRNRGTARWVVWSVIVALHLGFSRLFSQTLKLIRLKELVIYMPRLFLYVGG